MVSETAVKDLKLRTVYNIGDHEVMRKKLTCCLIHFGLKRFFLFGHPFFRHRAVEKEPWAWTIESADIPAAFSKSSKFWVMTQSKIPFFSISRMKWWHIVGLCLPGKSCSANVQKGSGFSMKNGRLKTSSGFFTPSSRSLGSFLTWL